jgi:hypothetical protein
MRRTGCSHLENGGRYKHWSELALDPLPPKTPLNRRFLHLASQTPKGKYAVLFNVVQDVHLIDGLFSAFDLTGVGPRV